MKWHFMNFLITTLMIIDSDKMVIDYIDSIGHLSTPIITIAS